MPKRSNRLRWGHQWQSIAVDMTAWNSEFLVAHASGAITRFARDGTIKGRLMTDGKLVALAVVSRKDRSLLVADSGDGLTLYDRDWKVAGRLALKNTGLRVLPPGDRLLAFVPGEGVVCVDLAASLR